MNLFRLIWANLFRKPTRTTLTALSIMVAFLLFMLLRSIADAFSGGIMVVGADRLSVGAKYSMIDPLPYNQRNLIESVPGVDSVTHWTWFGGTYIDPRNFFPQFPVEPRNYFDMYPEYTVEPADAVEKFANQRTAAIADISLMERFDWSVGDVVPIIGNIYRKEDGTDWQFEIVGTYSENGEASGFPALLLNYDYIQEATGFNGAFVSNWRVKVSEPDRINEIANEIDTLFENSADPTRTATEDEASRNMAKQLGDMGFITTMIMSAVFFTIILLTGNTMAQALRERIPELAVLKTLGFTDRTVLWLVLAEAIILCVFGGAIGVALAYVLGPGLSQAFQGLIGAFELKPIIAAEAAALMIATGVIIGLIPALSAKRLAIVDALRKQ